MLRRSFRPTPASDSYGEPVDRTEACRRLGLDPQRRYALFFGLIREYKGLDWLLEAWAKLRAEGRIGSEWRLIVAGECYTDPEPYRRRIVQSGLEEEVTFHDRFIPDERVKDYFSAAEFLVLPYKSATQSGVTQIAYQFRLPVIVTRVGGLAEIVPDDRVGFVCPPRPKGWPTPSSGSPTPKRSLASGRTWSGNASASRGRRCAGACWRSMP